MSTNELLCKISEAVKWFFTDFLKLYISPGGALIAVASALGIVTIIVNLYTRSRK